MTWRRGWEVGKLRFSRIDKENSMAGLLKAGCALLGFGTLLVGESVASVIEVEQLAKFDISEQVPLDDEFLARARKITVAPGANIPEHEHSNRPGIVYVLSGEITEFRGDKIRILKAGQTLTEQSHTTHRFTNHTQEACVLLAFDIVPPKPES